jgi:hypothetical protein
LSDTEDRKRWKMHKTSKKPEGKKLETGEKIGDRGKRITTRRERRERRSAYQVATINEDGLALLR